MRTDSTPTHPNYRHNLNLEPYEQFGADAAFLWVQRSLAVDHPQYRAKDIADIETRIEANLDSLMAAPDMGWDGCEAAMGTGEPGDQFTATVIALRSHDTERLQLAVHSGLTNKRATKGLISAFGWLPRDLVSPWIHRLLTGKDMNHKYLGLAACSVRRQQAGQVLAGILARKDCQLHLGLYARALRLVGELRRQDLMPALLAATQSNQPELAFWANWSAILLGQFSAAKNLKSAVFNRGPFQTRAIDLAFRVLPVEQGREWISAMSDDPNRIRSVIRATAVLGDPHAINWLITKMDDPFLARLAGEAFSLITGVDLVEVKLNREAPDEDPMFLLSDFGSSAHVGLDEDENLPWPDQDKIASYWRSYGKNYMVERRYFMGRAMTPDFLKEIIARGTQRQRHAAALQLALIDPRSQLINTHGRVLP